MKQNKTNETDETDETHKTNTTKKKQNTANCLWYVDVAHAILSVQQQQQAPRMRGSMPDYTQPCWEKLEALPL